MDVKLQKGNVVPVWLLVLRILWAILSNVVHVAAVPFGLIYFSLAKGTNVVNRWIYKV